MNKKLSPARLLFILAFFACAAIVYVWIVFSNTEAEILAGNIRYSHECGWITQDHAIPDGPRQLLRTIYQQNATRKDSFDITYRQTMKYSFFGKRLIAEAASTYRLATGMSKEQTDAAALLILMDVSEQFEDMQGSLPYKLTSEGSSFRKGDLTGNLLAYYKALHSASPDTVTCSLTWQAPDAALHRWQHESSQKQKGFIPVQRDSLSRCFLWSLVVQAQSLNLSPRLINRKRDLYFE
ncbi:hypothetical protein QNI16_37425 [Cytophagaceae bacterium YF14B1]|uniref:Uncharacterized protein n=1 Tax=Xanthocytophaga flava TaxID=3048013 RepID=A0AAE3QVM3_9BACT|nr:hypothetical protein [Xanthocytophaga flavus]MDJ1486225.1 hypothetical protein [Xanthocytophaga flavus]